MLTDGRAGNETQALGLAEAIARIAPAQISVKRISLKWWAAPIPPALSYRVGAWPKGWPFSGIEEGSDTLHWPWPDTVVAAGRRVAPIAAALRQLHGVTAVQILDPQMPPSAFDAVIVPQHDRLAGANVLTSVGALSRLTRTQIEAEAEAWRDRVEALKRPRLAVLIGGPSKSAKFTTTDERTLLLALDSLAGSHGLMITTSRRTRPAFGRKLTEALGNRALVWEGGDLNPYPGMLGLADSVLVTEDSVNMASEAASTGLPVHVFPISSVAEKLARFHESLSDYGASRRFTGQVGEWSYEPLEEADRIATDLARREIL